VKVCGPNQVWIADITYIRLKGELVYLAVVLDAFSRKVVYESRRRLKGASRYGVPIFNAGDVAPEQSSPLLNVALGEVFCFAQFFQAAADNHGVS
jgi:hypothetical protein